MAYTPDKPKLAESSDELRARIPGWGADLDPKDRPSVPQEVFDPDLSGAHWEFPERQPERWPRERSIEHKFLTPVFGTSCPPRGLSGAIRKYSYAKYSEGRAAHWLLLLAADRVDVAESRVLSLLTGRPDRLIAETGMRGELSHHGLRSRLGRNRADVKHHPLDPIVAAAPWIIGACLGYAITRRMARNR
ncbi:hypothetical protein AB0F81_06675 [Actinoplanes sp. NPDC024001]|uniref:hypothetical protein n=1 Tax=Actinoplanes sp. NPDC024001 TaxID=3154598 RepID=UPI0033F8FA2C